MTTKKCANCAKLILSPSSASLTKDARVTGMLNGIAASHCIRLQQICFALWDANRTTLLHGDLHPIPRGR